MAEPPEDTLAHVEYVREREIRAIEAMRPRVDNAIRNLQNTQRRHYICSVEVKAEIAHLRALENEMEVLLRNLWECIIVMRHLPRSQLWPGAWYERALWMWEEWQMLSLTAYRKERAMMGGWEGRLNENLNV